MLRYSRTAPINASIHPGKRRYSAALDWGGRGTIRSTETRFKTLLSALVDYAWYADEAHTLENSCMDLPADFGLFFINGCISGSRKYRNGGAAAKQPVKQQVSGKR